MKVLAISASPRRGGNSDLLCDEFLKGAAESGHETRKYVWRRRRSLPVWPAMAVWRTTSVSATTIWPRY